MNSTPRVCCILLNWNGWQDTIECLDALKECTYQHMEIVVVDNGSTNGSVSKIKAAYPSIAVVESKENLGFAKGCNLGIRYGLARDADYLWLLNNDTKPSPDALSALIAKALTDRRIAAVASICYYYDDPSTVQAWAGARLNLWIGYGRNSVTPREDDWFHSLYGASMLIQRSAFEDVGLLDEGFFLYWEETEFCLRLRQKSWKLAAAPDSRVLHKLGAGTKNNSNLHDRYFTASGLRILKLHSPAPVLAMFLSVSARLVRRAVGFHLSNCRSVWAGVQDYRHTLHNKNNP
jgi:GT2 family glycosyltransferase